VGNCAGRDADTGVRYLKDAARIIRGCAKRYGASPKSEANRVVQKIHDDLFEPRSISLDDGVLHLRYVYLNAAILRHQLHLLRGVQSNLSQVDIDPSALCFTRVKARQHQETRHQVLQSPHLFEDAANAFAKVGFGQARFAGNLLQLAFDDRERRAQLMGCIGQKAARGLHRVTQPPQHRVERDRQSLQGIPTR